MHRSTWRASRWPLAAVLSSLITLGACAGDEQPITAPTAQPKTPNLAVGDVITVTNSKGGMDAGSLRWAVAQATGGEIIRFDARLAGTTIPLDTTLVITNPVTIEGPADKGVTISGGGRGRVIDVATMTSQPVTKLLNVSITGGKLALGGGAGIRNSSPLVLEHSTVWGNEAPGSTALLGIGELTIVNSTISGNTTTLGGYAAIAANAGLTLVSSTVAYNSQGGISVPFLSWATLQSSIIANNGSGNCSSDENITIMGRNLSNDLSCGDSTVTLIADAKLQPLRDNGGPSMTHAIAPESPAFNAGSCNPTLTVDQRYQPRDERCDIGAFESTDRTTVTLTIDRSPNFLSGTSARVTGTVTCSRGGDQFNVLVQLEQRGPDKTVVQGSGMTNLSCTTTAQTWTALVVPSSGAFTSGGATATATTQQAPTWVTPETTSRSIKLVQPGI